MADTHNPSFEDVDRAMDAVAQHVGAKAGAQAIGLPQICSIWPAVKTVLQLLVNLPFIPEKWKKVIRQFIAVVDGLCSSSNQ